MKFRIRVKTEKDGDVCYNEVVESDDIISALTTDLKFGWLKTYDYYDFAIQSLSNSKMDIVKSKIGELEVELSKLKETLEDE